MPAIRMLFSWLTEKGILVVNPAREVKTEKFSRTEGKTPAFDTDQVQKALDKKRKPKRRLFSALRLEDRGQPCRARPRSGDFGSHSVAEPHAVKTVAVMSDVFDCAQIHGGMPADLDERIAA
jgi:hypothetical protein